MEWKRALSRWLTGWHITNEPNTPRVRLDGLDRSYLSQAGWTAGAAEGSAHTTWAIDKQQMPLYGELTTAFHAQ